MLRFPALSGSRNRHQCKLLWVNPFPECEMKQGRCCETAPTTLQSSLGSLAPKRGLHCSWASVLPGPQKHLAQPVVALLIDSCPPGVEDVALSPRRWDLARAGSRAMACHRECCGAPPGRWSRERQIWALCQSWFRGDYLTQVLILGDSWSPRGWQW